MRERENVIEKEAEEERERRESEEYGGKKKDNDAAVSAIDRFIRPTQ